MSSMETFWVVADVTVRMPLMIAGDENDVTVEQFQETADYLHHEHFDFSDTYRAFRHFIEFLETYGASRQAKTHGNWGRAEYGRFKIDVLEYEEDDVDVAERRLFEKWLSGDLPVDGGGKES